VRGRLPVGKYRRVAAVIATRHVWSVFGFPVGRVLELIDDGFEQQNGQEVSQNIGSGGLGMGPRWPAQSDDAFEAFEGKLDAPTQAIKIKDIIGWKVDRVERGDQDHPLGSGEGVLRYGMPSFASIPARHTSGGFGGFLTATRRKRYVAPDLRPIPIGWSMIAVAASRRPAIKSNDLSFPSRHDAPFHGARTSIGGTSLKDRCNPVGLQICTVANAYFAFDRRDPIKRLAALLIGQFEEAKALAGQVESTMDPPHAVRSRDLAGSGHASASINRISRPWLALGAPAANALPTNTSSQDPQRRKRWSSATFDISTRPTDAAQPAVDRNPPAPRQYAKITRKRSSGFPITRGRKNAFVSRALAATASPPPSRLTISCQSGLSTQSLIHADIEPTLKSRPQDPILAPMGSSPA